MKKKNALTSTKLSKHLQAANDYADEGDQFAEKGLELLKKALVKFRKAGWELRQCKKMVPSKQWTDWVNTNFHRGIGTAQIYMRVSREWKARLKKPFEDGKILSLNDCRRLLAAPEPNEWWKVPENSEVPVGDILQELHRVKPGLAPRNIAEYDTSFIFHKNRVMAGDAEVRFEIDSTLDIEGAIQAPKFLKLLEKLCADKLEFRTKAEPGRLIFETKKGKKRAIAPIAEVDKDELDKLPQPPTEWTNIPEPDKLAEAVRVCIPSCGRDYAQLELVCLHLTADYVESTDTYHAARYKVKTGLTQPMLLEAHWLADFHKYEFDQFASTKTHIFFRNQYDPKHTLFMSWWDDPATEDNTHAKHKYPNLDAVFRHTGDSLHIPRKPFKRALDTAIITARPDDKWETPQITIHLYPNKLRLFGQDEDRTWRYMESIKVKYAGPEAQFIVPYPLLAVLIGRTTEFRVAHDKDDKGNDSYTFFADCDDFEYATSTATPSKAPAKSPAKKKNKKSRKQT